MILGAAFILYGTLGLCALLLALLVYRYDMYDREPWYLLLLVAALGAGFMWLAGRAQVRIIILLQPSGGDEFNFALAGAAAITEELGKLAAVAAIALFFRRHFNDPMDGIIYGSFAGLGAAIEESIVVLGWPTHQVGLPLQEPVRLAGHLIMGGIGGFGLGFWAVRRAGWVGVLAACWATAAGIHFLWDIIAFRAHDLGRMVTAHTLGSIGLMVTGMGLYAALVVAASGMSRRKFEPRSDKRLLGWPFTTLLSKRSHGSDKPLK